MLESPGTHTEPGHITGASVRALHGFSLAVGLCAAALAASQQGLGVGIAMGIITACVVSGAIFAFATFQARQRHGGWTLVDGERLIMEGAAKRVVGWVGIKGWLYLTSTRLHFRSHLFCLKMHDLSLPLSEIKCVGAPAIAGLTSKGLSIRSRRGTERFTVQVPDSWVAAVDLAK